MGSRRGALYESEVGLNNGVVALGICAVASRRDAIRTAGTNILQGTVMRFSIPYAWRSMKRVYVANDPANAEIVKDYLDSYGIKTYIKGALLWGGRGLLPVDAYPEIWVVNEVDAEQARALILQLERMHSNGQAWRCRRCGEQLGAQFTQCWHCGQERTPDD